MLLVDKYSPKKIEDLLGNKEVLNVIKNLESDFPNLLFTGPPGTGKTTIAHLLKNDFVTLELNASDERGIDTVRTTLKNFCTRSEEKKLIILDECDNLTAAAQQALRRTMEKTDTKFILICNQISEIIEPIQSRCAVLKFEMIRKEDVINRIKGICQEEGILITEEGYSALFDICSGDMRACLGSLEAVKNLKRPIDEDFLYKINGMPNFKTLDAILAFLRKGQKEEAIQIFNDLWKQHYEPGDIMNGFFKIGKDSDDYDLLKIVGRYVLKLSEGVNSKIQFLSMFNDISLLYKVSNK